jgi:hypothetical protein
MCQQWSDNCYYTHLRAFKPMGPDKVQTKPKWNETQPIDGNGTEPIEMEPMETKPTKTKGN